MIQSYFPASSYSELLNEAEACFLNSCRDAFHVFLHRLRRICFSAHVAKSAPAATVEKFTDIAVTYNDLISAICYSYSSSLYEFDDLKQDALINIWRGLVSFRGDCGTKTWIYRVVINSCISVCRKQSKWKGSRVPLDDASGVCEETEDISEEISRLHDAIYQLSPSDRAIVIMWLDDCSYDEIAGVMGMSRNAVATRLHRIKGKLGEQIRKDFIS